MCVYIYFLSIVKLPFGADPGCHPRPPHFWRGCLQHCSISQSPLCHFYFLLPKTLLQKQDLPWSKSTFCLATQKRFFFLCRKRGHLSWQAFHCWPGTQPLQNNTTLKSPTHTGSGAVSPVEGFQLHLRACVCCHLDPGWFWWRG